MQSQHPAAATSTRTPPSAAPPRSSPPQHCSRSPSRTSGGDHRLARPRRPAPCRTPPTLQLSNKSKSWQVGKLANTPPPPALETTHLTRLNVPAPHPLPSSALATPRALTPALRFLACDHPPLTIYTNYHPGCSPAAVTWSVHHTPTLLFTNPPPAHSPPNLTPPSPRLYPAAEHHPPPSPPITRNAAKPPTPRRTSSPYPAPTT